MPKRLAVIALAMCTLSFGTPPVVAQQDGAFLRIEGDWTQAETGKTLSQKLHFANQALSYGLTYDITVPDDLPPGRCTSRMWAWKIGYVTLGMPAPINANWYCQAFPAIHVDGESLHDRPGSFRAIRHAGPDVLAEGTWQSSKGPVLLRLLLRARDDKLFMQVALPPKNKAQQLEVKLNAYPQGFPEPRARRAATAAQDIAASARIDLAELQQPWILLYDELYDKDDRGGGPCGLVYVPQEVDSAVTSLGSYGVTTTLKAGADRRTITVGLWDFTFNRDVATVRRYLRDAGPMIAADVARVAAADWHKEVPPAQLPDAYQAQLAKRAAERRQSTPYDEMTRRVVTPHVKWACPVQGGPVRTLAIGPRWHQRETVELAQRLDVQYDTVCFCAADSLINPGSLYLYGSYDLYGYPRKNATDVLYDLTRKLNADCNCMLLSGFHPELLPPEVRQGLVAKVHGGRGLLLFGDARKLLDEFGESLEAVDWQPAVVPLEHLPATGDMLADGRPVCSAYRFGQGRVLVFHWNTGNRGARLAYTPGLSHEAPGVLGYYDYFHSLIARGVLWAAGRQPAAEIRFGQRADQLVVDASKALAGVMLEIMVHDPGRGVCERRVVAEGIDLPQGTSTHTLPPLGPATGPRLTSVWLKQAGKVVAWGTGYFDLGEEPARITAVDLENAVLEAGAAAAGTVRLSKLPPSAKMEIELRDSLDRLLGRHEIVPTQPAVKFRFELAQPLAILHEIRVRLFSGKRLLDQRLAEFTVPDRRVDDFQFLVWSSGSNHAVRDHINRALAEGGVDWIDNTGLTGGDARRAEVMCRNAARHGLASVPYITRIASMQQSGRERRPCLHDPKHIEPWTAGLTERAQGARPFGPPAYTLGDENFLVHHQLDVCIAPPTLAAFHEWLEGEYGSIAGLNETWHTDYTNFGDIVPPTFEEVRAEPDHWPRWADHRRFMDRTLTRAHVLGRDAIRRADPQARVGFDGVFSLDSWHGYDFYALCRACDLVQVYAVRPPQIEYLRSWHLPDAVRGAWYNHTGNIDEISAKALAWHLLFHGLNSSWYWTSYNTGPALLFPDLRPTPQFEWMQDSIGEIKAGIGKLLLAARREHDGIAIHYSQPSVHAGTLMNRSHAAAQWGFARLVEDLGLQYDMLADEQIREGKLDDYRVLLMGASAAIGPEEAEIIRQFVEQGGTVVADTLPGILDEHCRLLETGQFDKLFGVKRTGLPETGDEAIGLSHQGLPEELSLKVYDTALKAVDADTWGAAGDVPAVLVRRAGQGQTVLLNASIEAYDRLHKARNGLAVASVARQVFAAAGVEPQATVTVDGRPIDSCELVRFTDGAIRYVALVRDHHVAGMAAEDATVEFSEAAQVYDIRAKQSLGRVARVTTRIDPGEPKVYALLPHAVESIAIVPNALTARPGAPALFRVTLDLHGNQPAGRHCLRIEVAGPDGSPLRHYAKNVPTEALATQVSIPLALNDAEGTWQLRATDVASGQTCSASLVVANDSTE